MEVGGDFAELRHPQEKSKEVKAIVVPEKRENRIDLKKTPLRKEK